MGLPDTSDQLFWMAACIVLVSFSGLVMAMANGMSARRDLCIRFGQLLIVGMIVNASIYGWYDAKKTMPNPNAMLIIALCVGLSFHKTFTPFLELLGSLFTMASDFIKAVAKLKMQAPPPDKPAPPTPGVDP